VRCKTCHYSLANLTEHRCPECGRPFDPHDPSTFKNNPATALRRKAVARAVWWLCGIFVVWCIAFGAGIFPYSNEPSWLNITVTVLLSFAGTLLVSPLVLLQLWRTIRRN
jgi:hypothetical protein